MMLIENLTSINYGKQRERERGRGRGRREKERGGGKEVVVLVEIHDAHAMGGVSPHTSWNAEHNLNCAVRRLKDKHSHYLYFMNTSFPLVFMTWA